MSEDVERADRGRVLPSEWLEHGSWGENKNLLLFDSGSPLLQECIGGDRCIRCQTAISSFFSFPLLYWLEKVQFDGVFSMGRVTLCCYVCPGFKNEIYFHMSRQLILDIVFMSSTSTHPSILPKTMTARKKETNLKILSKRAYVGYYLHDVVANKFNGKTSEEIRKAFNINNETISLLPRRSNYEECEEK